MDPEDRIQNGGEKQMVNITSFCPDDQVLQCLCDSSICLMGPILAMDQGVKEVSVWALNAEMGGQGGTDLNEQDP